MSAARVALAEIRDLPPGIPAGSPIQVSCSFTAAGRLLVKAQFQRSGQALAVDLRRPTGMSEAQLVEWRKLLASREGLAPILTLAEKQRKVREDDRTTAADRRGRRGDARGGSAAHERHARRRYHRGDSARSGRDVGFAGYP